MEKNFEEEIISIFNSKRDDLRSLPRDSTLTIYQEAAGFDLHTTNGSRHFDQVIGYILHNDIAPLSQKFNKLTIHTTSKCDGENSKCLFEIKSKFNTMKGSQAVPEISPKLKYCIENDLDFKLLVFTDKKNMYQNIPLHKGSSLKQIQNINGYDSIKHRWISGDEVWKYLFDDDWKLVKKYVLDNIKRVMT